MRTGGAMAYGKRSQQQRSRPQNRNAPDTRRPVPRSRSGFIGRHYPRSGTEPVTARSALGLRLLLAICFTPLFVAATVLFAVWSTRSGPGSSPTSSQLAGIAGACGALALISAVDLVVILRRRRRERLPRDAAVR
ncbi:DUF6343 family protein [Streptomyces sp. NPDC019990]|uniref:DUF6343 family protein n=1 Tax=Streptomyces sp. NPDC019990 TaxID=3154693 RepID=UPI0033C36858